MNDISDFKMAMKTLKMTCIWVALAHQQPMKHNKRGRDDHDRLPNYN